MLFLHKLGWEMDLPLLEAIGVRLLAGQNDYGGWGYHCPLPAEKEIARWREIALGNNEATDPQRRQDVAKKRKPGPEITRQLERMQKDYGSEKEKQAFGDTSNTFFSAMALNVAGDIGLPIDKPMVQVDRRFGLTIHQHGWAYYPGRSSSPPPKLVSVPVVSAQPVFDSEMINNWMLGKQTGITIPVILAHGVGVEFGGGAPKLLTNLLAKRYNGVRTQTVYHGLFDQRDPSTWRAHEWYIIKDVPVLRGGQEKPVKFIPKVSFVTMALSGPAAEMQLLESQGETGKLAPNPRPLGPTPAMTANALACLALGIAANRTPPPFLNSNSEQVAMIRKGCVIQGLHYLTSSIGEVQNDPKKILKLKERDNSYYFLFSLNQAATLLGVKTIGGKDWRAWGTQLLLANQRDDGSWKGAFAQGGADTAFALMFLSEANVAPYATEQLEGMFRDPVLMIPVTKEDKKKRDSKASSTKDKSKSSAAPGS
jgi:hypothetical protein